MSYYQQYKPFIHFLGRFFVSYLIATFLYQAYLQSLDVKNLEPDAVSRLVSKQCVSLLNAFDYESSMIPSKNEPSYRILVDGSPVVRIVEGCNAVSVMILFMAFVVAFTGKLKTTIWFIIAGILLIHVLNVSRISTLIVGLIKYPQYGEILHDIVFPLIIYGVTFVLWVIWVTKFSNYAK